MYNHIGAIENLTTLRILSTRDSEEGRTYRLNPYNPLTYMTLLIFYVVARRKKALSQYHDIVRDAWKWS